MKCTRCNTRQQGFVVDVILKHVTFGDFAVYPRTEKSVLCHTCIDDLKDCLEAFSLEAINRN